MTIMPVETELASYEAWTNAVALLRERAAELGLVLIGWGAVPAHPPEVKLEEGIITCPHCRWMSEDLGVMFASDAQPYASPEGDGWEVQEPEHLQENAAMVAYVCPHCNGFVQPTDDVVVI